MLKGLGGGLGALGDMSKMMARAQEMQSRMAELQEKLETMEVEGVSGAGLVRASCNAKGVLRQVEVDPSLMSPGEREVLQDLVVAAVADAQAKAQERAHAEMTALAGELGLPAGMMPQQ